MNYLLCDITFGAVPVGNRVVKIYPLTNEYSEVVSYYIIRDKRTNPIYHVFDVNKYECTLKPNEEFTLKINYTPKIPGSKDIDYFMISNDKGDFYRLSVRGTCIGPSVSCSIRNLTFLLAPNKKVTKQVILLTNHTKVPAIFQFECNEEEEIFTVSPTKGTLRPDQHQYIEIRFSPRTSGLYSHQLWCLIFNHEPVPVNLFGISSKKKNYDSSGTTFRHYRFPHEETVGFRGYFSDSVIVKRVPPPVSLSVNYLDFGRIFPESSCQTLTTSLTNHMSIGITVEWENVKSFQIYPKKLEIPPKRSALYECRFLPEEPSTVAWAIFNGHVSWSNSEECNSNEITIPIPISLHVIGHSFPKDQTWITNITITPKTIVLPLTSPGLPSWTTFMIHSSGHLPALYKLVPPSKTNFIMKPMMGLIRDYQIVAVQLEANTMEKKAYVETWSMEVNGQMQYSVQIHVKAQTDIPNIVIADNNYIEFETVQPGTKAAVFLPIRNISYNQLQFEFEEGAKFVADPPKATLGSNEEIFARFTYSAGFQEAGLTQLRVICRVQNILHDTLLSGEPIEIPITVVAKVIYSELCALPQVCQGGQIEYGTVVKTYFYIFNFGESNIHFNLKHNHNLKDVTFNPAVGSCGSKEKLMVRVEFVVHTPGKHSLLVAYNNRFEVGSWTPETVWGEGAKVIFTFHYECIFPIVQIVRLVEHNFGYIFSNQDLWEYFKIDEINAALIETNKGEIRRVNLCVPDSEMSNRLFYLVFLIKNVSPISAKLVLKWIQGCNCKQKESQESFTFRIKVFECPHKDMLRIDTSNFNMMPDTSQTLTFKIRYLLPYENTLAYIMELGHERTVILNISANTIPVDYYKLSVFQEKRTFNLGYVYIGLHEAPVFAFWLYNNTNKPTAYKLKDVEIVKLCNGEGFTVLKCLNSVGFVKPHSSAPLLFKFWPIEEKLYKVAVPLFLGEKQEIIDIEGYGTLEKNKIDFDYFMTLPLKPLQNNLVCLSIDSLIIEPILATNFTERMFFMKNLNPKHQVKYLWKPCLVDGLVKIEPLSVDGVLNPKELQPVVIKITSLGEPCSIKVSLHLEFVDYDKQFAYEEWKNQQSDKFSSFSSSQGRQSMDELMPEKPQYFNILLPIMIHIVGISDRDNCISAKDQMKQKPFESVDFDVDKFVKSHFQKEKVKERPISAPVKEPPPKAESVQPTLNEEVVRNVLEHIVGDAVFSDYFVEIINNLKTEPSPLYSQVKLTSIQRDKEHENETKKILKQPKLPDVANICKDLVLDSMHEVFRMGPVRKSI